MVQEEEHKRSYADSTADSETGEEAWCEIRSATEAKLIQQQNL